MSEESTPTHSTIDPYKFLQIVPNADGTLTRDSSNHPSIVAIPDPGDHTLLVLSKDVLVNQLNNTWVRMFLPRQALDSSFTTKLPLIVHFHGGGFIILSAAIKQFHDFCSNIAIEIPAMVVSLNYRLAPEHRLPAAYNDAMEVLHWIKTAQDEWLQKYVDFSCCFLMGESAGGNIAYHTGLRAAAEVDNLLPLKIKGLILNSPYFGGINRTESELRLGNNPVSPLCVNDLMWELSLPIGADRDHEYCNPTVGGGLKLLDQFKLLGWKVLVTGGNEDPLIDRHIELTKLIAEKGVKVVSRFDVGGHGTPITPTELFKAIQSSIKSFFLSLAMVAEGV
ncbi:carboxylesterase 1-like [Melia azedarach]|uniref:Carboxylesterase 1-like n=1 Tax=Melia azedarach TaxID=155640 RepID=A0ACC1Y1Y5_MELAZ|nr:carboxylesterase 1-like [Melia azedarach]